jgi:hypothetical protein
LACSTGLASYATTMNMDSDIEATTQVGDLDWANHSHTVFFFCEENIERLVVDHDHACTFGDPHAGDRSFATASTEMDLFLCFGLCHLE